MALWKELIRRALRRLGYRINRLHAVNRFQAMEEVLLLLRRFGFDPRVVIDAGANMGQWTRMAWSVFPTAEFHLIEPQSACAGALQDLAQDSRDLIHFHPVAVTESGVTRVRMIGGGQEGGGTDARVARNGETAPGEGEEECPATTLDALLAGRVAPSDRALLKLDLEGGEMHALAGAPQVLGIVEVVLTEVRFYDVSHRDQSVFADVLSFLRQKGFDLWDFASLASRPRDMRLRLGDVVFVRRDSPLAADLSWE